MRKISVFFSLAQGTAPVCAPAPVHHIQLTARAPAPPRRSSLEATPDRNGLVQSPAADDQMDDETGKPWPAGAVDVAAAIPNGAWWMKVHGPESPPVSPGAVLQLEVMERSMALKATSSNGTEEVPALESPSMPTQESATPVAAMSWDGLGMHPDHEDSPVCTPTPGSPFPQVRAARICRRCAILRGSRPPPPRAVDWRTAAWTERPDVLPGPVIRRVHGREQHPLAREDRGHGGQEARHPHPESHRARRRDRPLGAERELPARPVGARVARLA